jgi:hypothetical protein
MLSILFAMVLGIWLLFAFGRARLASIDSILFMVIVIILTSTMHRSFPVIEKTWMLQNIFLWVYVFVVIWLLDIICFNFVNALIYAVIVSAGCYYIQSHALNWAKFILN